MIPFLLPTIAVLAFVPALFILYQTLSEYTWPKSEVVYFEDTWIFGLVAVGLILGAVLFFLDLLFSAGGFLITVLFLAAEQLVVLVILNFPKLRLKGATRFYGFSLGTAMSAGLIMGQYAELFRYTPFDVRSFALLLIYSVGLELLGGSTGSIIGYAIERRLIPFGIAAAIISQAAFGFLIIPVFSFAPSLLTMGFDAGALLLSLLIYVYVMIRLLPQISAPAAEVRKKRLI